MPKPKTCLNCRRRKIKCDGQSPKCGQCLSSRGFVDCEYPGPGQTPTQLLRERIAHLQNRIHALENPRSNPSVALSHPYLGIAVPSFIPPGSPGSLSSGSKSPSPMTFTSSSGSPAAGPNPGGALDSTVQEPVPELRQHILNNFLSECRRFGFFLEIGRFNESFLLHLPLGHFSRPLPALICAVYLWSSHLFPSQTAPADEQRFLRSTLHHLARDLSGSHPLKVPHALQAEVLLSYYYLKNGKMLQGNYHANTALSLSLSSGLHRIQPPNPSEGLVQNDSLNTLELTLAFPAQGAHEAQRIDAFWAVLILNNYWVVIQESRSMFYDMGDSGVDTPWPTDRSDLEVPLMLQEGGGTLQRFLDGTSVAGFSTMALHAKATILLEQATLFHSDNNGSSHRANGFATLNELIDRFHGVLGVHSGQIVPPALKEIMDVTQIMAHAATIKLHHPFSGTSGDCRNKTVMAAQSIAFITKDMIPVNSRQVQVNPILGILWTWACEALVYIILSDQSPGVNTLLVSLEIILSQMTRFSQYSILMKILVMRLENKYSAQVKARTAKI